MPVVVAWAVLAVALALLTSRGLVEVGGIAPALFVVGCQYGKRSVPLEEYESLNADPAWAAKALL